MAPPKKLSTSKTPKKAAARSAPAHPSWTDMIKECIAAYPEDARHGVSRPQIKKFVEERYKLDIGNAQTTQLSRAIAVGAEKNIFSLPKGPSGRVKLAPKPPKVADDATKEPASKTSKTTTTKTVTKPATKPGSRTKAVTGKSATTKSAGSRKAPSSKSSPAKAAPSTKTAKKQVPAAKSTKAAGRSSMTRSESAVKKTYAGKKLPAEKKVKSSASKGTAKK
ncbi:hypothetical protein EI94DRAFT_1264344 [Lactarius quietus]|nr:hypothetical protein EI94DRAFT_1264344 [Lactarius quietus]